MCEQRPKNNGNHHRVPEPPAPARVTAKSTHLQNSGSSLLIPDNIFLFFGVEAQVAIRWGKPPMRGAGIGQLALAVLRRAAACLNLQGILRDNPDLPEDGQNRVVPPPRRSLAGASLM